MLLTMYFRKQRSVGIVWKGRRIESNWIMFRPCMNPYGPSSTMFKALVCFLIVWPAPKSARALGGPP